MAFLHPSIVRFLLRLFRHGEAAVTAPEPVRSGVTMVDAGTGRGTRGKLFQTLAGGVCPRCSSRKGFYKGPEGGMSTNIFCANRECRAGYNITPVIRIAEPIHDADLDWYRKEDEGKGEQI